jgi:hypothetical protein
MNIVMFDRPKDEDRPQINIDYIGLLILLHRTIKLQKINIIYYWVLTVAI